MVTFNGVSEDGFFEYDVNGQKVLIPTFRSLDVDDGIRIMRLVYSGEAGGLDVVQEIRDLIDPTVKLTIGDLIEIESRWIEQIGADTGASAGE